MHEPILYSGWEALIRGVPMVGLLFLWIFHIDSILCKPRRRVRARRPEGVTCSDARPCDPDGRPWPERERR